MAVHSVPKEFFLDEKLYKVLRRDRVNDELLCWEFRTRRRVILSYSYVRDYHEKAYNIHQVSEMIGRSHKRLRNMLWSQEIYATEVYRSIETNRNFGHRWSPRGIMELRDFFAERHRGRPRNDGKVIPWNLPTKQELRAMLDQEVILYVKTDDGEFVPTWKA